MSLKIFSKWFNPPFLTNARYFFFFPLATPTPTRSTHGFPFFFYKNFFLFHEAITKLLFQKFHKQKKDPQTPENTNILRFDKDIQLHCLNLIAELDGAGGGR